MSVVVRIPTPLRRITGGQDKVTTDGNNLREIIDSVDGQFNGIKERMCDDSGELRNFVKSGYIFHVGF